VWSRQWWVVSLVVCGAWSECVCLCVVQAMMSCLAGGLRCLKWVCLSVCGPGNDELSRWWSAVLVVSVSVCVWSRQWWDVSLVVCGACGLCSLADGQWWWVIARCCSTLLLCGRLYAEGTSQLRVSVCTHRYLFHTALCHQLINVLISWK